MGDALVNPDIVADYACFADDDPGSMVDKNRRHRRAGGYRFRSWNGKRDSGNQRRSRIKLMGNTLGNHCLQSG